MNNDSIVVTISPDSTIHISTKKFESNEPNLTIEKKKPKFSMLPPLFKVGKDEPILFIEDEIVRPLEKSRDDSKSKKKNKKKNKKK
jgi:hypothetical protein